RIIRKVVERYAAHPAVIGYQVDNEPGLHLFHNSATFVGFVRRLEERYGDVETLNREWGLTYWSHRIADWSELWVPDGNSLPQYDLEWRRYQAELTEDFIAWQADIVRGYAKPGQFVTTCMAYPRPALDDRELAAHLDVTAGNPYYLMQDHLDATEHLSAESAWTTTGVPGLLRQADRLFSSKQSRFLVTETDAQSIGSSFSNIPPWPGQLKLAAFALISRGAAMIEYWHWHTIPYGTETYWGGVLPHSLKPGRVYREVSDIGADLKSIGTALDGFEPDADVAVLWSNDSRWAFDFFPPLGRDGHGEAGSYERIVDSFYRGVIDAGAQARILHVEQALSLGVEELVRRYPVLIAAGLYVASDDALDLVRGYAEAGGHLILGPRTGYADELARARVAVAPDRLHDAAGVYYEEYSNVSSAVPVDGRGGLEFADDSAGTRWIDGLVADGAEVLATYRHPGFGAFPAVTSRSHGAGRITVAGTLPSPELASSLVRWALPGSVADELAPDRELPVLVSSGLTRSGCRAWFIFNWSWHEQDVTPRIPTTDASTGAPLEPGTTFQLPAWSTRILLQEQPTDHHE
ncbi:MAG: beta-galactosidase, partial [Humibacter sp.]